MLRNMKECQQRSQIPQAGLEMGERTWQIRTKKDTGALRVGTCQEGEESKVRGPQLRAASLLQGLVGWWLEVQVRVPACPTASTHTDPLPPQEVHRECFSI